MNDPWTPASLTMAATTASADDEFVSEAMPWWSRVTLFALYVASSVLGLCGNGLIVFTLASDAKFRQSSNTYTVYLCNLVVTDLYYQLYFFPSLAAGLLLEGKYPVTGQPHCIVNGFTFFVCSVVFLFTLSAISFDRYMRVCRTQVYMRLCSRRTSFVLCLALWALACLVCLPSALDGTIGFDPKTGMCFLRSVGAFTLGHTVTVCVVAVTAAGVTVPNILIYRRYNKSRRRVGQGPELSRTGNGSEAGSGSGPAVRSPTVSSNDIALLRSLLSISLLFFVLTMPATLLFILRESIYISPTLYGFFMWLYAVNSSANWVVYGVMNTRFREGYRRAFTKIAGLCHLV